MKTSVFKKAFALAVLCFAANAGAADIDIYGGLGNAAKPNILIVVDNTSSNDASFSSACPYTGSPANLPNSNLLDMVYCALYGLGETIKTQPALLGNFNVGLMVGGSGSNKGGEMSYPSTSPYNFPLFDTAGITGFQNVIVAGIPKATGNAKLDGDMTEVWAFFTGNTGPRSGTPYSAHIGTQSCQRNFVIFIGAASKQGRPCTGSGCGSASELAAAGATAAQQVQIDTSRFGPDTSADGSWIDEWARFLYQTDFNNNQDDRQNVVTYTIAAGGDVADYVQLLHSMAAVGGGKAFVGFDYSSMRSALLQIFNEVAAVNSVFGSATLPVSVNTRGTYQNQVYMGMFRPDANGSPRWMGNLKQYQFGVDTTDPSGLKLFLADSTGAPAISGAGTGFISPNAVSFWTNKDTTKVPDKNPPGGFWLNNPIGVGGVYDSPDGEIVEKGGVGQQIRLANILDNYSAPLGTSNPRNVYTCTGSCTGGSSLSATPFATSNTDITATLLNTTTPTTSVSSISRASATVTMVLSSAPTPALTSGQSVTVAGAANAELNGIYPITLVNATTFTYTIRENPASPSTGTYVATLPSTPKAITSLTRSGATVTATLPAHGFVTGDVITISGATGARYNGTYTITVVNSSTFTYTIVDNPLSPGTGGTATVGTSAATIAVNGIVRGATAANNTSQVVVTATANLPSTFAAGAKVTITGASPIAYNVTLVAIIDGAHNGACGANGSAGRKVFCFTIATTPNSPDTGGSPTADKTSASNLSSLTHAVTCTGSPPTNTTTVTATTSAAHSFSTGNVVSIGGSPVGANEGLYVGNFAITRLSSTQFTYTTTTTPPCSPSASGVTVTTSSGGVDRNSLINWMRGEDSIGDEQSPDPGNTLVNIRPSVHGDVLHSRPSVINYGGASNKVVVFYGSNDGQFRAVNGNKTGNIGTVPPGGELWSFIPVEFMPRLQRLYSNLPLIKLPTTPNGIVPTPTPKDYFFDGITGVYQTSVSGTTYAYIYLSARRGGRLLYALDVSDPSVPKFLWKKGCPNVTDNVGCDSGFSELGQTWSQPKVASVKGWSNPVLIFGAGYDANEDIEPPDTPGTGHPAMGRGIFVLDAVTGCIVWQAAPTPGTTLCTGGATSTQAGMTYAMPSDITLINRDYDKLGKIDRLYAADLGGNIWRVDLEPAGGNAPANWQVTKLASLGGSAATKRKFFYPADVVTSKNYDMVLIGSGDREHPLYSNGSVNVVNRFYGLKDLKTGMDAMGATTIVDSTASDATPGPATLFDASSGLYDGSLAGYYYTLGNKGEKVVNAPTTIGSFTYFGTNQPPQPSMVVCNNLGIARGYQVNHVTGALTSEVFDGGGLPPSPTAGVVTVQIGSKETSMPFVIGAGDPSNKTCIGPDCKSSIGAIKPVIPVSAARKRIYWYLDKQDN